MPANKFVKLTVDRLSGITHLFERRYLDLELWYSRELFLLQCMQ